MFFKVLGKCKERQLLCTFELVKKLVTHFLHHSRTRVKTFVNSVSKAHESETWVFIFSLGYSTWNILYRLDIIQHSQTSFISATMSRTPERRDTSSNAGIRIRKRRASYSHSEGRCILLMICMQGQNLVKSLGHNGWYFIIRICGVWEHHIEEVFSIGELSFRIDNRESYRGAVGSCSQRREFSDEFYSG